MRNKSIFKHDGNITTMSTIENKTLLEGYNHGECKDLIDDFLDIVNNNSPVEIIYGYSDSFEERRWDGPKYLNFKR